MSKIFNFAMAATMAATALVATQMTPAQAHPHYTNSHMTCDYVYVSGSGAYLQHNPTLSSRRYRTAPHGEQFMVVKDGTGHAHHTNGWYLVKSKHGMRYWAHRSVLSCSSGDKMVVKKSEHQEPKCNNVKVSGSYAYGKEYPNLRSKTLRYIPNGEAFTIMRDSAGHAEYDNDWWFLSNSSGKFWVHDSVLDCAASSSAAPAPAPVAKTAAAPAPMTKVEVKKFAYKSGVDGCLQRMECAANSATSDLVKKQVTDLRSKVDDMLKNPLLKMGAEPACNAMLEQVKSMGLKPEC